MKKTLLAVTFSVVFASLPAYSSDSEELSDLPTVRGSHLSASNPSSVTKPSSSSSPNSSLSSNRSDLSAVLTPRVNKVIRISTSHPNRFTTPFSDPRIRTTSDADIQVSGRDIYISSNNEGVPIAIFVHDKDNPDLALSITFVPQRIPPVDLQLLLDPSYSAQISSSRSLASSEDIKVWEESSPYIDSLRNLMREVATGNTPNGYSLTSAQHAASIPVCSQSGLSFDFHNGLLLDGNRLQIFVGLVQNNTSQVIEFREPACSSDDTRAVAAWPNPLLSPGQKSEVFVIRSSPLLPSQHRNARPSLLH